MISTYIWGGEYSGANDTILCLEALKRIVWSEEYSDDGGFLLEKYTKIESSTYSF